MAGSAAPAVLPPNYVAPTTPPPKAFGPQGAAAMNAKPAPMAGPAPDLFSNIGVTPISATTGFGMVNQPNAPTASATDPLAQFANSGVTLPLSPNADPRGVPMPADVQKSQFAAAAPRPPEASYGGAAVLANAVGSSGMLGAPAPAGSGKGGGGAVGQPMPRPTQGQFAPLAPQGGFNVNQASAGALQQAMQGTQGAMQGPLAVNQFMNPYTQNVINRTQMDIMRQQQMAQNQLGAQATAARAFGGSRQGVAEGVLAGEYGRMAGDIAAQQRQAGYTQALDAAMRDRAARAGYAQQLAGLGQQAFQTGQTIQQQQAQQGLLQQGIQQALIDAARQQYGGYVGAPAAALQAPLAALGVTPVPEAKTSSYSPGLFDYLKYPLMGLAR